MAMLAALLSWCGCARLCSRSAPPAGGFYSTCWTWTRGAAPLPPCAQTYLHFITGLLCLCANIACSPLSLDIPTANVGMTSFDKGIKTGVLLIFDGHERTSLQNCGSLPCTCILPFCSAPAQAHFLWSFLRVFIQDPLGRALFLILWTGTKLCQRIRK
jgi:hypothetical protein